MTCCDVTQVACGGYHTILLTADGRIVTFGNIPYYISNTK